MQNFNLKTFLLRMKAIKERLSLISPLTWPAWIGLGCLWLITRLPYSCQKHIGHALGKITYWCSPKLRHITETNIRLCFPRLSAAESSILVKKNFASLGMGIIETAMAWWVSDKRLSQCKIKITGVEFADAAFAKGNGILLLSPHFSCLEMIGRLLGARYKFAAMYRPHKIRLIAYIQERFREKYQIKHIARHRMREVLHTFQENMAVWYAYDIDAGPKRSVFAPFFGIETASLTSVSRLVEMTGAAVVPIEFYRLDDEWGYEINLHPALENFPGTSREDDAGRLNAHLEAAIRNKPEQYIWQYKRFKTRPAGEKRFY
jgi:KDO2-lipid IV(A) lauroyltransferase